MPHRTQPTSPLAAPTLGAPTLAFWREEAELLADGVDQVAEVVALGGEGAHGVALLELVVRVDAGLVKRREHGVEARLEALGLLAPEGKRRCSQRGSGER